jgi:hypothetical protein
MPATRLRSQFVQPFTLVVLCGLSALNPDCKGVPLGLRPIHAPESPCGAGRLACPAAARPPARGAGPPLTFDGAADDAGFCKQVLAA